MVKTGRRICGLVPVVLAFVTALCAAPSGAWATGAVDTGANASHDAAANSKQVEAYGTGDFVVTGGTPGTDYTFAGGVLTINSSTPLIVSMAEGAVTPTTDRIVVASGENETANLTLDGVNIDVSGYDKTAALLVDTGSLNLTLAEGSTNILKSGSQRAGLQNSIDQHTNPLTISGVGALEATGGSYSAGIGGGYDAAGSDITIKGGIIKASGNNGGAGIGGCSSGAGSNITISGGTVEATGDASGAGIGGGRQGAGSDITISGGKLDINAGSDADMIGGGSGGDYTNISITGGSFPQNAYDSDADTIYGVPFRKATR